MTFQNAKTTLYEIIFCTTKVTVYISVMQSHVVFIDYKTTFRIKPPQTPLLGATHQSIQRRTSRQATRLNFSRGQAIFSCHHCAHEESATHTASYLMYTGDSSCRNIKLIVCSLFSAEVYRAWAFTSASRICRADWCSGTVSSIFTSSTEQIRKVVTHNTCIPEVMVKQRKASSSASN